VLTRLFGYVLFCAGGGSMAFAAGAYGLGEWRQQDARRAWEESEARAVVALARREAAVAGRLGVAPILSGAPVAHIEIPRIGLDEIVMEGVDDYALNSGPGHLPGSAFPGERGNSVISAHRDRHFARLGELSVGDTIYTEAGAHRIYTEAGAHRNEWVVIARRVVEADAPALFRTEEATLTITTCWPIRYVGTAPQRLIVTAKPIGIRSFANARTS
jgi:sortase A